MQLDDHTNEGLPQLNRNDDSITFYAQLQKRHDLLFLLMNAVRPNPDTFVSC